MQATGRYGDARFDCASSGDGQVVAAAASVFDETHGKPNGMNGYNFDSSLLEPFHQLRIKEKRAETFEPLLALARFKQLQQAPKDQPPKDQPERRLEPCFLESVIATTSLFIQQQGEMVCITFLQNLRDRQLDALGALLETIGSHLKRLQLTCSLHLNADLLNRKEIEDEIKIHLGSQIRELRYSVAVAECRDPLSRQTMTSQRRLRSIVTGCKASLQKLSFENCTNLCAGNISEIVNLCQELRELNLANCKELTGQALASIAEHHGTKLKELSLVGCKQLDKTTLGATLKNFVALEGLDLTECHVDKAVLDSLQGHRFLRSLSLARTALFRDDLLSLTESAFRLEYLDLFGSNVQALDLLPDFFTRHFFVKLVYDATTFQTAPKALENFPLISTHQTKEEDRLLLQQAGYLQLYLALLFPRERIFVTTQENSLSLTFSGFNLAMSPPAKEEPLLSKEMKAYLEKMELAIECDVDLLFTAVPIRISQLLEECAPFVKNLRFMPNARERSAPIPKRWHFPKVSTLSIGYTMIEDEDFFQIDCPKLNWLNISHCKRLTLQIFFRFPETLISLEAQNCPRLQLKGLAAHLTCCKKLRLFSFDFPKDKSEIESLLAEEKNALLQACYWNVSPEASTLISTICQSIAVDGSNVSLLLKLATARKIDPLFMQIRLWLERQFGNYLRLDYVEGELVVQLKAAKEFTQSKEMMLHYVELKTELAEVENVHFAFLQAEALTVDLVQMLLSGLSEKVVGLDWIQERALPIKSEVVLMAVTLLNKLQKVGFSKAKFPEGFLLALAKKTPQIFSFSLRHCVDVLPKALLACQESWKSLVQLSLSHCEKFRGDDFVKVASSWPLRHLKLANNSQVTDLQVAKLPQTLELLDLSGTDVTDGALTKLCQPNTRLHTLRLNSTQVSLRLPLQAISLKHLELNHCPLVTDETVQALPMVFPVLQSLSLKGCGGVNEEQLYSLCQKVGSLRVINVHEIEAVSPLLAQHLLHPVTDANELVLDFEFGLSSIAFELILLRYPRLHALRLRSAKPLENETLARALREKELSALHLEGMEYSELDAFQSLGKSLKLQELSWQGNLTCRSMVGILQFKTVKKLTLINTCNQAENERVNNDSLSYLSMACRELQEVTLVGFGYLTNEALQKLSRECTKLKSLSVSAYPGISFRKEEWPEKENFTLTLLPLN